jgi:hypothetical protein
VIPVVVGSSPISHPKEFKQNGTVHNTVPFLFWGYETQRPHRARQATPTESFLRPHVDTHIKPGDDTMHRQLIAAGALFCTALVTQAQTTPRPDDSASMVKPPSAPGSPSADTTRPNNPDNMPVKKPAPPPGSDRMLHHSPASDAIAK